MWMKVPKDSYIRYIKPFPVGPAILSMLCRINLYETLEVASTMTVWNLSSWKPCIGCHNLHWPFATGHGSARVMQWISWVLHMLFPTQLWGRQTPYFPLVVGITHLSHIVNWPPPPLLSCLLVQCHAAKSLQSCPTLCDPIDSSPPGSPVPGILQARTLEWVAISFSSAWKWKVTVKSLSRVRLCATPWTATHQAPPSVGSSRQEYWSGVPWGTPNGQVEVSTSCESKLFN